MPQAATTTIDPSHARRRLPILLLGNALMRTAGGASGVMVGLLPAEMAERGAPVNTAPVGTLGAVSFAAEVVGTLPNGTLVGCSSAAAADGRRSRGWRCCHTDVWNERVEAFSS
jgi:hypothetical protein